jgi:hypothetical protein
MPNPDEQWTGRPTEFGDLAPFTLKKTEYLAVANTQVHCFPVTLQGDVIGYLWASETEAAADFYPLHAVDAVVGYQAAGQWRARLMEAFARGTAALNAVRQWIGAVEDPVAGGVAADAVERVLPDSAAVRVLTTEPH